MGNPRAVRVARKTYVVDLASGNRRTDYVAVSNTAMGVLLLVTGVLSSGLAQLGVGLRAGVSRRARPSPDAMGRTLPEAGSQV